MSSLHQMMSAEVGAWADCGRVLASGDALVLIDRGVEALAALEGIMQTAGIGPETRCYASKADVQARGLFDFAAHHSVHLLDDDAWVSLVIEWPRVLSWR
jgi:sulfur relay protein TusB/DsrH